MSWRSKTTWALILVAASLVMGRQVARAQSLTYTSGQNISPAYEGWEEAADGSKYFLFGYMNRNWLEEIDVSPGPDNTLDPGGPDLGQPTHFLPRRNRFVFRVAVPKNFTDKDELVWTLTTKGKTEKAYATLRPDYKIDDVVKASETGALGAGTSSPEVRANTPPVVTLEGPKTRTVKVGEPLTLVALVKDDGVPKRRASQQQQLAALAVAQALGGGGRGRGASGGAGSAGTSTGAATGSAADGAGTPAGGAAGAAPAGPLSGLSPAQLAQLQTARRNPAMVPPSRITVGKVVGLHLSWFVYRGAGKVTFNPEQVEPWEDTRAGANSPWAPLWTPPQMPADGKVTVEATFTQPGTYLLRGLADDGALFGGDSVTVTVTR